MVADMASGCVIGVDLGGTKLLAGTVDGELRVHHRAYRLAQAPDAPAVIDALVDAINEGRDAAGGEVRAVGVGIPSLMDLGRGVALSTNHLPLTGVGVRDLLAERLGLPVFVDNDATAEVWCWGANNGILGTADTTDSFVPVRLYGFPVTTSPSR